MTIYKRPGVLTEETFFPRPGGPGTVLGLSYYGANNPSQFLLGGERLHGNFSRVGTLFTACNLPKLGISEAAFREAAEDLGVEIAVIKTIAQAESKHTPFDGQGRPTILFERHYFHKLTAG